MALHPTHQIRRIVTGHDDNGKAIIESDGICPHVRVREGAGFVSSLLWVTAGRLYGRRSYLPRQEADPVREYLREIGMDVGLDFHGRVHRPMAKRLARELEPLKPLFIEEPLLSENIEGLQQLAALTTIPIALGERLYDRWDFKPVFEARVTEENGQKKIAFEKTGVKELVKA